jgi:hypothetical protein
MLYRFHANIFARPPHAVVGEAIDLRGLRLPTIRTAASSAFYDVTFEQARDALAKLSRLDIEPDGFFVVTGESRGQRWQLDGHFYDFNDRLHRVELHGQCPHETFDALLACLGWPATPLAFELVMEGVALDEAAFRAWASSPA